MRIQVVKPGEGLREAWRQNGTEGGYGGLKLEERYMGTGLGSG